MQRGSWNDQREYPFQEFSSPAQKAAWPLGAWWVGSHSNCIVCLYDVQVQAGLYQPAFAALNSVMSFLIVQNTKPLNAVLSFIPVLSLLDVYCP